MNEGIDQVLFICNTVRQFPIQKRKKKKNKAFARRILKFPKSHSTAL